LSVHPAASGNESASPDTFAVAIGPSWQLFPNDLLVFERVLGPNGPSRVLMCFPEFCTHSGCTCREVTLKAVTLEFAASPDNYEELRRLIDEAEAKFFQIDLDASLVDRVRGEDPRPPLDDEWLVFLRDHVDGDLLDRLHERWIRAKGIKETRGWRSIDWSKRDPHEMVIWEEMFPEDRVDHFLVGDRVFFASEHYCRKPACACGEARVGFTEIDVGGKWRDRGSIRVALPSGTPRGRDVSRRDAVLVDALWAAYAKRHRVGTRLTDRNQHIQRIAPLLSAAPAAPATPSPVLRVGRNDLCPCGSGKKFKRCCGG
jgi:hypothetical protein